MHPRRLQVTYKKIASSRESTHVHITTATLCTVDRGISQLSVPSENAAMLICLALLPK